MVGNANFNHRVLTIMKTKLVFAAFALALTFVLNTSVSAQSPAPSSGKKPNILVIMGDDIGWFNPSCYNSGIMGYRTPNIDRIAFEGARFANGYGQQSCTAERAAFNQESYQSLAEM